MTTHQLIYGDSKEILKSISGVNLIVTSPPYNVGKEYEQVLTSEQYEQFLFNIYLACYNSMVTNSRICINVPYQMFHPDGYIINPYYHNLNALLKSGFKYRHTVTWNQYNSESEHAWGSFRSPSAPWIRHKTETIIIMYKGDWKLGRDGKSDITSDEFCKYTLDLWGINPIPRSLRGHPAPFPDELPYRCIKLFSYIGDTVLDPFIGSGTTSYVAKKLGRNSIGIDLNPSYIELAKRRLSRLDGSVEQEVKPMSVISTL